MAYQPSTGIKDDQSARRANVSFMRALRTEGTTRLVGTVFTPGTTIDTNFWTAATGTGGTVSQANAIVTFQTGTTANNAVSLTSVRSAAFKFAHPHIFRGVFRALDTGTTNNVRRWGPHDANNGYFFQLSGTTFSIGSRKATVDTTVAAASFNGPGGTGFSIGTNARAYEIHYFTAGVEFYIDGVLYHTLTLGTAPMATSAAVEELNLPITITNTNSGGSTTNVQMECWNATILRIGQLLTAPQTKFQNTVTGSIYKRGPGLVHRLIVGGVPTSGAVVTLYDNTAASGTVLAAFTFTFPGGGNINPSSIDFGGMPFTTGLYVDCTVQAASITVVYE